MLAANSDDDANVYPAAFAPLQRVLSSDCPGPPWALKPP
jgi:hypothetical protein